MWVTVTAMAVVKKPVYYWSYLHLDELLSAQEPLTDPPAHDELLFIVVHQAFELWFKQILFELDAVLAVMGQEVVAEKDMGEVVSHLQRITKIQRLLTDQIDVLETMTPLDFLEFRDVLIPASGFQSVQFRLIENKLGLDTGHRLKIKGMPYTSVLSEEHAGAIEASEREPSLHDHLERWLRRTPFLSVRRLRLLAGLPGGGRRDDGPRPAWWSRPIPSSTTRPGPAALADFEPPWPASRRPSTPTSGPSWSGPGKRRLSHRAFLAALLINLYRDEPIFQLPFRFLTTLVDIDEGFTTWRHRHALLAHRMIGSRIGTGGTAGHEYLDAAARRHRVFTDLFDLPTFFIPRSALPPLPAEVAEQMGFRWGQPSARHRSDRLRRALLPVPLRRARPAPRRRPQPPSLARRHLRGHSRPGSTPPLARRQVGQGLRRGPPRGRRATSPAAWACPTPRRSPSPRTPTPW